MREALDVLGLGNSLVDIIAHADDEFLIAQDMVKGAMTLIDEDHAETLYALAKDATVMSGGSAANTIVGVASFALKSAYIGKVKHDELGATFRRSIRSGNVVFDTRRRRARPGDRPQLHLRHSRRRADDEYVFGRKLASFARRRR